MGFPESTGNAVSQSTPAIQEIHVFLANKVNRLGLGQLNCAVRARQKDERPARNPRGFQDGAAVPRRGAGDWRAVL